MLASIAEHGDQTRSMSGHERQLAQTARGEVNADKPSAETILLATEMIVKMAHRCPVTCAEVQHGLAMRGAKSLWIGLGAKHSRTQF